MHLGLIGFGNIATALAGLLAGGPVSGVTVLVRPEAEARAAAAAKDLRSPVAIGIVTSPGRLLAAGPDVVAECAGHGAVEALGADILSAGCDLIVASVGALADDDLRHRLDAAARSGGGRLILPSGAIGGLDLLTAIAPAGGLNVTYRGIKPPAAWKDTPAEDIVDLDNLTAPARFFAGTAREAARLYPKNANVVAALALAGAGFDATRVELIADPAAPGNRHAYDVVSPLCRYSVDIAAAASSGNVRTSATTAYSMLAEIRRLAADRRRDPGEAPHRG